MTTTTTLPAPMRGEFSETGSWPHMPALRRELKELVADLDPIVIGRGEAVRDAAERLFNTGFRRIAVGVYAPIGRDEAWLGWYPRERLPEVTDRVLAYLPGARQAEYLESERSGLRILWGSREPGWSPTAVWVARNASGQWAERTDLWDADQCAEHVGTARTTWQSYVSRSDAGAPGPFGTIQEARGPRGYTVSVWDPDRVRAWHAERPGKGGRPARRVHR